MGGDRSHSADNPPEFDDDPYEDVDIDALPNWWRRNVETFRSHEMRPYRPPVFKDGVPVPPVVDRLENELDVSITLSKHLAGRSDDDWTVRVDDRVVASAERTRDDTGRSVYSIGCEEFESAVRRACKE